MNGIRDLTQLSPGDLPIVTLDTSVLNRLVTDSESCESLASIIRANYYVRMSALCIEDFAATPDRGFRKSLCECCEALIRDDNGSDCLLPYNVLVAALILEHYANPKGFHWLRVDVRAPAYHKEIREMQLILDDELSADTRLQNRDLGKQYRHAFTDMRPKFDQIFAAHSDSRPTSFRDAVKLFEAGGRKIATTIGKRFYDGVTKGNISRQSVQEFIADCPPFRALIFVNLMSEYDLAMADSRRGERFKAGRNDMYMSVYLPYADVFVTDERYAEQERCLREIAAAASLGTNVVSFDDFRSRMLGTQSNVKRSVTADI